MQMSDAILLSKGRYQARIGQSESDLARAWDLRSLCFQTDDVDRDEFDSRCVHVLVETQDTGQLICCFRMQELDHGTELKHSYSAQFYDLSALSQFSGRMVEIGRFCIHPDYSDADVLRVAWGAMTAFVDRNSVEMLFGCSSFSGTHTGNYLDAFALLKHRYLGPKRWSPQIKAPDVYRFATVLTQKPDIQKAMKYMPPLLRTYLSMGGWVSDHAVVDHHMNTLHVFTCLEIRAIPPARKRLLRAVVG